MWCKRPFILCQGYGPHNVSIPRSGKAGKIPPADQNADAEDANEITSASLRGCIVRLPKVRADGI